MPPRAHDRPALDLRGRRALVTGGAAGIGRATVDRLVELGASVVVADVDPAGPEVARAAGAHYVPLDVSRPEAWQTATDEVRRLVGGLDLLVLNAGVNTPPLGQPFGDDPLRWLTTEGYRRTVGVNVEGVVHGVVACLPVLRAATPADLLVTGSIGSAEPITIDAFYTLSKHAIAGFVRALAPTTAALGIRTQLVCPGGVDTALVAPDVRVPGRPFAPASYVADAFVTALARGTAGDIWVAPAADVEPYLYTYAPMRPLQVAP